MTSYQLPITQEPFPSRRAIFNDGRIKKLFSAKQQPSIDKIKCVVAFNPLEILDIFEHGKQIKVIERPANHQIIDYLSLATAQLGAGFKIVLPATQAISARLLTENILPNHAGRDIFLAELDYLTTLYIDMLGCPNVGVRLEVLSRAMCPKFHVDKTGIRLLCTYVGAGTEWLDDAYADRTKLGMASAHIADNESGLISDFKGIHQVGLFDITLLKGSMWQGNAMRGVIHRSPHMSDASQPRVMLAIDAMW